MNKRQLESLIKSGSLDSLGVARSKLLAVYEKLLEKRGAAAQSDLDGQIGMFDLGTQVTIPKPAKIEFPDIAEMTTREKLSYEKESCGLYLSGHILDDYNRHLSMIQTLKIGDIKAVFQHETDNPEEPDTVSEQPKLKLADKSPVTIAGTIIKRINKATKNGDQMAFITLEDRTSSMELICFQRPLQKYGAFLIPDSVIAVSGTLSVRDEDEPKLLAERVVPLIPDTDTAGLQNLQTPKPVSAPVPVENTPPKPRIITKIYLRAKDESETMFRRAKAVCSIFSGAVPVIFYFNDSKEYKPSGLFLNPTEFVIGELKELLGDENVVIR
jgi:DNA polymerase-3 subunit alpha